MVPRQRVERCVSGVGVQYLVFRQAGRLEPSARVALAFRAYRARVLLLDDDGNGNCEMVERTRLELVTSEVRARSPRLRSSRWCCVLVPSEGIEPSPFGSQPNARPSSCVGKESDRG